MPKKKRRKKSKHPHIIKNAPWWFAGVIFLVVLALGLIWSLTYKATMVTSVQTHVDAVVDEGVTWLGEPQLLADDLKLFTFSAEEASFSAGETLKVNYYKLGTDNGQDIILAQAPPVDPSGDRLIVLVKEDRKYAIVKSNSGVYGTDNEYYGPAKTANVAKIDSKKAYKALLPPTDITVNGNLLSRWSNDSDVIPRLPITRDTTPPWIEKDSLGSVVGVTAWGRVYSENYDLSLDDNAPEITLHLNRFVLKTADGRFVNYSYKPAFVSDDQIPAVTWNDKTVNEDMYRHDGGGTCGNPDMDSVIAVGDEKNLVSAGKSSTGDTIYTFKNTNSATVKTYFQQLYNGEDYAYYFYNPDTQEGSRIPITIQEYLDKHGVFVYKDPFGRYVAFQSFKYGSGAECGKPVVYLYPEKTTPVAVTVGATVTKSEPTYGEGWNVVAQPNGQLTNVDGKQYDSLFWEGLGDGTYPEVNSGFVVPTKDVARTLKNHLAKLGLNAKESNDFMEFWLPKMPNTPYVRLTWFGTKQMNTLAPLTVSPKPETSIRLFLDFAGLNKPVSLPAQTLSAIPRQGFTLVEWGGLLRH